MSIPQIPEPVKLIAGIMFDDRTQLDRALDELVNAWGMIDHRMPAYAFTFTRYYAAEMGEHLWKCFVSFQSLMQPDELPERKLASNALEARFATGGRRCVNIDPGYLTPAKLVLATGKDFAHRLYLGKGIYGDAHLTFQHNAYRPYPWTYPDYQQPDVLQFFTEVRQTYMQQLHSRLPAASQTDT